MNLRIHKDFVTISVLSPRSAQVTRLHYPGTHHPPTHTICTVHVFNVPMHTSGVLRRLRRLRRRHFNIYSAHAAAREKDCDGGALFVAMRRRTGASIFLFHRTMYIYCIIVHTAHNMSPCTTTPSNTLRRICDT